MPPEQVGPDNKTKRPFRARHRSGSVLLLGFLCITACSNEVVAPAESRDVGIQDRPSRSLSPGPSAALTASIPASILFSQTSIPLRLPNDINGSGLVVGEVVDDVAAYWTETDGRVVLGGAGGSSGHSSLVDLNASGIAVGRTVLGGQIVLTRWSQPTNAYEVLPTQFDRNFAQAINDNGAVTGFHDGSGGRPFYRSPAGGNVVMLSFAPSFFSGISTDMNNAGAITGYLNLTGNGPRHTVVWSSFTAAPIDLGTLGGFLSEGHAINEGGDIVGWSEVSPGNPTRHAALWPSSGGIIDLRSWPNPCPGTSEAADVSDTGVIVGKCNGRPVLWTATEGMRYLAPGGGEARAINNDHLIIGTSSLGGTLWKPLNAAPIADAGGPYEGQEGSPVPLSAAGSSDPDGDAITYEWDFGDGSTGTGVEPSHTYADNGTYVVSLTVTDARGVTSAAAVTTAVIGNVAPKLASFSGTSDPIALVNGQATASFTALFADAGAADIHNGSISCDGGTGGTASVEETGGSGEITGVCVFSSPGVYSVAMTVSDNDGGSDSETASQYVVIFDPSGGFVTGGGWINSPAGAYSADHSLTGKATFGFVSKYQKGATIPDGKTEFQFHAGSFNFSSLSYQWLVVAGARAQFKGDGTVGGQSGYGFLLTAIDGQLSGGGGTDRFRIKIWNKSSGAVVYDNVAGAADGIDTASTHELGGGSISIKK